MPVVLQESGTLRAGAHADLVPLADVVLGTQPRHEVSLLQLDAGGEPADVVWAGPDDVARLHGSGRLDEVLRTARDRLRGGGLVLLPAPEPAELKNLHAVASVAVQLAADATVGPVVVWDFDDGGPRGYSGQQLLLHRGEQGWEVRAGELSRFRVPVEAELRSALELAGFLGAQRLSPGETGLSWAVWAAVAPSDPAPSDPAPSDPAPAG